MKLLAEPQNPPEEYANQPGGFGHALGKIIVALERSSLSGRLGRSSQTERQDERSWPPSAEWTPGPWRAGWQPTSDIPA